MRQKGIVPSDSCGRKGVLPVQPISLAKAVSRRLGGDTPGSPPASFGGIRSAQEEGRLCLGGLRWYFFLAFLICVFERSHYFGAITPNVPVRLPLGPAVKNS